MGGADATGLIFGQSLKPTVGSAERQPRHAELLPQGGLMPGGSRLQDTRLHWSPLAAVAVTTAAVIAISVYCLLSGWFIIFQNLFYFPILIACVYYAKRGFVFRSFS